MKLSRLVWSLLVAGLSLSSVRTSHAEPKAEPGVLYRLIQGSTLTRQNGTAAADTAPLGGTFRLVRQISPLDWENYGVQALRLEAPNLVNGPVTVTGDGFYSRGGRFETTQQLTLHARIAGTAIELTSGAAPPAQDPVTLDLEVQGELKLPGGTERFSLRVVAVPELRRWHYRLLGPSSLLEDCPPCGRPSIPQPLRGDFDLVLIDENPLYSRYHLFEINLRAGFGDPVPYRLDGEGSYEIGGEVAIRQTLVLGLNLRTAFTNLFKTFTNAPTPVIGAFPVIGLHLDETEGKFALVYRLDVVASPWRELWFSTPWGMTSGNGTFKDPRISAGDLLADPGRIVKRNSELMGRLGLMPGFGDYDVDAFGIASGGQVLFSLGQPVFSETLGDLQAGDLLSDQGRVAQRNQDLTQAFGVQPPVPDLGLDAVQIGDNGVVLFSINQDAFSERLGVMLQHGDLLSSAGAVLKTNKELLGRFNPPKPGHDYGLDAVYVWPHGEVWFSVAEGFNDSALGPITDGDLLSDHGFIVFKNLELVGPFSPLEDLANFGLDGLFVITDTTPQPPAFRLLPATADRVTGDVSLRWEGTGRVFQVERITDLGGLWAPISHFGLGTEWTDLQAASRASQACYRIRQW
jgi:hypothetical protein